MSELVSYRAAALTFVNETRATFDVDPLDELPKGKVGESCNCPIANALLPCSPVESVSTYSAVSLVFLNGDSKRCVHPPEVCAFVDAFDNHAYPDLIA